MRKRSPQLAWLEDVAMAWDSDECLIFPFGVYAGYAKVRVDGLLLSAHRHVCALAYGAPPRGAHAAHKCGVKKCVNKRHLRWTSRSENERDKISHGLSNRGERQGQSKLARHQVMAIRAAEGSLSVLARSYGVATSTIKDIKSRRTWAWL